MQPVTKAALKKFLHQHIDDMVDHFSDHALMGEAILGLTLSNRCVKADDEDIMVIEEIHGRIVPYNDPTDEFHMEDVEFYRTVEKDAKTIERTTAEIMGGGLLDE